MAMFTSYFDITRGYPLFWLANIPCHFNWWNSSPGLDIRILSPEEVETKQPDFGEMVIHKSQDIPVTLCVLGVNKNDQKGFDPCYVYFLLCFRQFFLKWDRSYEKSFTCFVDFAFAMNVFVVSPWTDEFGDTYPICSMVLVYIPT